MCQRKFYWTYIRNIVPAGRTLALEFGSAWHNAMNTWHTTQDLVATKQAFDALYTDDPNDERRSRKTAHRMLDLYAEKYTPEVFILKTFELWVEQRVGEDVYRMKVDGVIEWDGRLMGLEHKTASTLGYHYLKSFKPNLQLAGYVWGLQHAVDPSITEMLVDISRVTYEKPREGERFMRHPERVDAWEVEEFVRAVTQVGQGIFERGEAFEAYTPNWSACTQYGECAYRTLCTASPTIRESLIGKLYEPRKEIDADPGPS